MNDLQQRWSSLTPDQQRLIERRIGNPVGAQEAPKAPVLALSHAQRRFWWLHQLDGDGHAYNTYAVLDVQGPLQADALERSFTEVVRRHDILRTRFVNRDGVPAPIVDAAPVFGWLPVDLEAQAPADERVAQCSRLVAEFVMRPIDLEHGPLLRVGLWRLDVSKHRLAVVLHHIASDRWSMGLLVHEVAALYEAFTAGLPSPLPAIKRQYADYASSQEASLRDGRLDPHLAYWRAQLAGELPTLVLPGDRPRAPMHRHVGAVVTGTIPLETTNKLLATARGEGATAFMALLACFVALLHRYNGQSDIIVGTPVSGRREQYTQLLIGCFLDTLPLRLDVSSRPSFRELLARVRRSCLDAFSHQELPFERIVEEVNPDRLGTAAPLFRVMFTLNDLHDPSNAYRTLDVTAQRSGLQLRTVELEQSNVPCDLIMHLEHRETGLVVRLVYDASLFNASTAGRILKNLCEVVSDVAERPDVPVPLTAVDRDAAADRRALAEGPTVTYPYASIVEAFIAVARRTPEAIALVSDDGRETTYADLDRRSDQFAEVLQDRGLRRGAVVAILARRSADTIAATLAVLKIGAAYLPIDAASPASRRKEIIEDAGATLLLCDREVPEASVPTLRLDAEPPGPRTERVRLARPQVSADDSACFCFTSGSTGRPKGAVIPQRAVLRLLFGEDVVRFGPDERILQLAPFAFDVSLFEIWGVLLHGGCLVMYPDQVPVPSDLERAIRQHRVTTAWLTVSLFNAVVEDAPRGLAELRQLIVGGEALSIEHVRTARRAAPGLRFISCYGPTEATTWTSLCEIPEEIPAGWTSIPLGRSIANTGSYVLDEEGQQALAGVIGDLCVAGDGLAHGYVGRPRATAEKFVPSPFGPAGSRMYRTGDRAFAADDGVIHFCGRQDHQIKIRGFRVELREIEVALLRHPNVREAVVLYRRDGATVPRLVAYVAARTQPAPDLHDLKRFLALSLPEYMLPSAALFIESLPKLATHKIDRPALARMPIVDVASPDDLDVPEGEVERALAEIWSALLGADRIRRSDSFFSLGGHSILAAQLLARIERRFEVSIRLRELMEQPTIEAMARCVAAHLRAQRAGAPREEEGAWAVLERLKGMTEDQKRDVLARYGERL